MTVPAHNSVQELLVRVSMEPTQVSGRDSLGEDKDDFLPSDSLEDDGMICSD